MNGDYTVISLFAGGGGSSCGYKMAGYKELLAIEFDKNAIETLRANYDFDIWEKDITQIKDGEILKRCKIKRGELDILDGSPPCQGFSTAGNRDNNDIRNKLYLNYIDILKDLQPKVFIMENVSGMIKGTMKGKFNIILRDLKNSGYNVKCKLMNAKYYNVPQSRERLIFIGVRNDINIIPSFPVPNKNITSVKQAIDGIELEMEAPYRKDFEIIFPYIKQGKSANKTVPFEILKKYIPRMVNNKKFSFNNICMRLNPTKPSPTITKTFRIYSEPNIHYNFNRYLDISEVKKLCSFPKNYILTGSYEKRYARLGNAVMPKMMQAIAENIKTNILDKYYKDKQNVKQK